MSKRKKAAKTGGPGVCVEVEFLTAVAHLFRATGFATEGKGETWSHPIVHIFLHCVEEGDGWEHQAVTVKHYMSAGAVEVSGLGVARKEEWVWVR